jgi:hypothetical protein
MNTQQAIDALSAITDGDWESARAATILHEFLRSYDAETARVAQAYEEAKERAGAIACPSRS